MLFLSEALGRRSRASHKLQATSFKVQASSCKLQAPSFKLQAPSLQLVACSLWLAWGWFTWSRYHGNGSRRSGTWEEAFGKQPWPNDARHVLGAYYTGKYIEIVVRQVGEGARGHGRSRWGVPEAQVPDGQWAIRSDPAEDHRARLHAVRGSGPLRTTGPRFAVGTPVAGRPPHGSVLEGLAHMALTSGVWRGTARWDAAAMHWPSGLGWCLAPIGRAKRPPMLLT